MKASAIVVLFAAGAALHAASALAGNCRDPWVTKAITQVTGRSPNGSADNGECDYRRYGGGHWTSYDDLLGKVRKTFAANAPKITAPPSAGIANRPGVGFAPNTGAGVIGQNGANVIGGNTAGVIGQNGANMRRP